MKVSKKKFRVVVRGPQGNIIVHSGEFDPTVADEYVINIYSRHARKSLIYQEVKRAIGNYEDKIMYYFESMPKSLQNKVSEYIPLADMKFREWLREIRKQVVRSWKI